MKRGNTEQRILLVGVAWIIAGMLSAALGGYLSLRTFCNCPEIPANATAQQAHAICPCPSDGPAFIAAGALGIAIGASIVVARRRIATYV